jgi:hypothetical protein
MNRRKRKGVICKRRKEKRGMIRGKLKLKG